MGWGDNTKGPWGNQGGNNNKPPKDNKPSGGGGGNNFGGRGPSNNNKKPFDIDKFFKPGAGKDFNINEKSIIVFILLAIIGWALTGFYVVDASEEGIVLRFGKYHRTATEGLRYHLPSPIERAYIVKKTIINSIQIGYRSSINQQQQLFGSRNGPQRQVRSAEVKQSRESLMITGDTNIADVTFVVQWRIKDSFNYLFQVAYPIETMEETIKAVSESAMREVIGRTNFAEAMTTKRSEIENNVQKIIQSVLDSYKAGVEIYSVNLNDVQNPEPVMDAFLDVETAKQDKETSINKARSYQNEIIPRARGEAQKVIQEAEAYKSEVISIASGEAQRFANVYKEYAKAKDVTKKRIYLETMQKIFAGTDKVIMGSGTNNVVPYLPLPEVKKRSAQPPQPILPTTEVE